MLNDNLHEPFTLVLKEYLDVCPRGIHTHSFFELIYIVAGTGEQCINETRFDYRPNHLFLLTPGDSHYFDIKTPTQFFFIRFNNVYIQKEKKQNELIQRLEMILRNARQEPGCILRNYSDKVAIKPIMEALIREHLSNDLYHKELITQYINTLLVIVARNISLYMPDNINASSEDKAISILQYIQSNICSPDKLRIEHISDYFGLSATYLSRYFKKHTEESFQHYIIHYKLKLIENRLLHSNMRISEIADEFGFTDKSHLTRIFKKYMGMNPTDFKKNHQAIK